MEKAHYQTNFVSLYKNGGQAREQWLRFVLTGEIVKADHKPYYMGGDIGSVQVKSSKATVCNGYDLQAHIARDAATRYAYVTLDYTVYYMSTAEWVAFVEMFSYKTYDSTKNSKNEKLKLYEESKKMLRYLEERSR